MSTRRPASRIEGFGGRASRADRTLVKRLEREHASAWSRPASTARFVGSRVAEALRRLGVETVEGLLWHAPFRYLDMGDVRPISSVRAGEQVTVAGTVKQVQTRRLRRGLTLTSVGIFDGTAYLFGTWFNQHYVADRLPEGTRVVLGGKATFEYGRLQIQQPFFDIVEEEAGNERVHTSGVTPVYPATEGLSSNMIRRIMRHALDDFGLVLDPLPVSLRRRHGFVSRSAALADVHFPLTLAAAESGRRRLAYEELLVMQAGIASRRARQDAMVAGIAHEVEGRIYERLCDTLTFRLTADQQRAIEEIHADMRLPRPMSRLLQGEVGSGKTAVAMAALAGAVESGYQAAIMAPTEVLAIQHFEKVQPVFSQLGVTVVPLTGAATDAEKHEVRQRLRAGEVSVVVGTQALIQESVDYDNLGLVVIDEQHRFGVRQRLALRDKGSNPDVLVMTATPIPRTLALTLYGDLDVSVLRELPGGQRLDEHVQTMICDRQHRDAAYGRLRSEVAAGRQAYVVCPLIDESEKLDVKAVTDEFECLGALFPDLDVGLLHGRLRADEKNAVMRAFRDGKLDILLATTVIEVGIDVPNATVMIIEDAERFGLSQLHQLRGRIGRGGHRSYCILFADPTTDEGRARMEAIATMADGFALAEADMRIRGEGQLFGPRQAGLPDLRLASLTRDQELLELARQDARELVASDPSACNAVNRPLAEEVRRRFESGLEWMASG